MVDRQQNSPIGKGILDVVTGGVDEDTVLVPSAALDSCIFMHRAEALQLAATDGDGC